MEKTQEIRHEERRAYTVREFCGAFRISHWHVYLTGWRRAFSECDDLEEMAQFAHQGIADAAKSSGLSMVDVEQAIAPGMGFHDDGYALGKDADF